MPTLQENLIHAHSAIEYVKKQTPFGADNRPESTNNARVRIRTGRLTTSCILPIYRITKAFSAFAISTIEKIDLVASVSMFFQAGNCGEQAAIAFQFLKKAGVQQLDYVYLFKGDHAFVVIGRDENSDIRDFCTWGRNTVVCDPWGNRCYPAIDLIFQLNDILIEANFERFNPITQTILSACSYNNLSPRPAVEIFTSPAVIRKATTQYQALENLRFEIEEYLAKKEATDKIKCDAFRFGRVSTSLAISSTFFQSRSEMAKANSSDLGIAALGLFSTSLAEARSAKHAQFQEEKFDTIMHNIWK